MASATRSLSIFSITLPAVPVTTSIKSLSISSSTPVLLTTPSKYLLDMDIVLFTRFPSVFASSELILSIISSHDITPSFSNGISCNTKKRIASTPKKSTSSSAYKTFPLDLLILPSPCRSQGCPNICFGSGISSAISIIGQYIVWNRRISFPIR